MTFSFREPDDGEALPAYAIPSLTDREFRAFRAIIENGLGTQITDQKRQLIQARLARRVRSLHLRGFGDYLEQVLEDPSEMIEMFNRISTNETAFFREPKQFELLERDLLPGYRLKTEREGRKRSIRVWSAGCSTGQEPFSIAMTLLSSLPGWSIEVLATDVSTRALDHAQRGVYSNESLQEIPLRHRNRFVQKGVRSQSGSIRMAQEVRSVIRFERLNLHQEVLPDPSRFDVIFCRNVLIYFDQDSRRRALDRMFSRLVPGGLVFLGHSESLIGYFDRFVPLAPSVYRMRSGHGAWS